MNEQTNEEHVPDQDSEPVQVLNPKTVQTNKQNAFLSVYLPNHLYQIQVLKNFLFPVGIDLDYIGYTFRI